MAWGKGIAALVLAALLAGLAGCDNGPSAVEPRGVERPATEARAETPDAGTEAPRAESSRERPRAANDDAPLFEGRPLWSQTRRYTAEENARRHYERNGEAVGARSYEDFLRKVHAFVADPPRGTETLTRANGDTLFYHAASNTFAVATRDGAPRTLFKPDDGAAYWDRQKAREAGETPARERRAGE